MIPLEETIPDHEMDIIVYVPKKLATRKTPLELAQKRKCPKFPGWEKVLHPSQPVVVVGKPPCPSRSLEQTYPIEAACNQPMKKLPAKTPSPAQGLEVAHQWKPTPSFVDITTCLRSQSFEEVLEMLPIPVVMGIMAALGWVTMSTSRLAQDEVTGTTYLDTVTTSIGRVALMSLKTKL